MQLCVDLQIATAEQTLLPDLPQIEQWVQKAILGSTSAEKAQAELTVRIVDSGESRELNYRYREKNRATNVLSFPFQNPPGILLPLLGDLIICKEVVENEALEQNKSVTEHWAHMLIHGTLHLLGYDHIDPQEALEMESLETKLLIELGFSDPYLCEKE